MPSSATAQTQSFKAALTELTDEKPARDETIEELDTVNSSNTLFVQAAADASKRVCRENASLGEQNDKLVGMLKEVLGTRDVAAGQASKLEALFNGVDVCTSETDPTSWRTTGHV